MSPPTTPANTATWGALRYSTFRNLWIATLASNVGSWMFSAASAWLMTSLDARPLIVSLVQVTSSLPLFLLALPAGAFADLIDKRQLILVLEVLTTVFSVLFALLVTLHAVTPNLLLFFIFLLGALGALETPAWQSIVPSLVPSSALPSAVATNSVGINISRVLGPALGGVLILGAGISMPFWLDAISNLGVIAVIYRWRSPARRAESLPAEHFVSAVRTGVRYARHSRELLATMVQAIGFFLFASAYWALLPIVSRDQLQGGPRLYGILLGAIGASAVAGAIALPKLKARTSPNVVVGVGKLGTAAALILFGLAHSETVAALGSLLAGFSWIVVLATLNVSAQTALPDWVRGRGLAAYVTVFFGTMSVGSALWGFIAQHFGLVAAHYLAAIGAVLATVLTARWKLHTGPVADLTPSSHWPEPVVAGSVGDEAGPVLVTVEYRVAEEHSAAFLKALDAVARERRRDGAYAWGVFRDTAAPTRYVETFLVDTWLEHLHQHQRVTKADRAAEEHLHALLLADPKVTHLLATNVRS